MTNRFTAKGYTGQTLPQFCPVCFAVLDGVTNLTGPDKPDPGDFTVCVYCRAVLKFGPDLAMELSSLEAVPVHVRMEFAKVIRAIEQGSLSARRKTSSTT